MASLFGIIKEETPKFAVIKSNSIYEVRKYAPYIRAQVLYQGDRAKNGTGDGFRDLAGYIFGGNTKRDAEQNESIAMTAPVITENAKIAMTAPVITENQNNQQYMSFTMPSCYKSLDELPIPKNENVKLIQVPESFMAVLSFSGWVDENLVQSKEKELKDALGKDGVKLKSENESAMLFQYNPPWTPPFWRKNEVAVLLDEKQF
jgi:hypothetical protein